MPTENSKVVKIRKVKSRRTITTPGANDRAENKQMNNYPNILDSDEVELTGFIATHS